MKKIIALSLCFAMAFLSCKNSETNIDKLEIAKQFYQALDNSDDLGIITLVNDSILIRETEADYQEGFSRQGFREWLKWESVFEPTYKILEIEEENGGVKAKISKIDKRLSFLHEEPMVWREILQFDNKEINRIERVKYEVFNVPKFLENRDGLVNWIKENEPELDGFLNDQTESGGKNYLKAIERYTNRK